MHPERFSWDHDYGPIRWPRDGRELFRVKAPRASYWKAETLDSFDGERWRAGGPPQVEDSTAEADLTPDWQAHTEWGGVARVTIDNLRSTDVVGPGTILGVSNSTRRVYGAGDPGRLVTLSELRRGDSYSVRYLRPAAHPGAAQPGRHAQPGHAGERPHAARPALAGLPDPAGRAGVRQAAGRARRTRTSRSRRTARTGSRSRSSRRSAGRRPARRRSAARSTPARGSSPSA